MSDYRLTEFCDEFVDLKVKKNNFKKKVLEEHPKLINFYSHLSDKDGGYKYRFISIYNDRCVYCGNSLDSINIDLFEIDHYINEASFSSNNKQAANAIENLVPACQMCNRAKSGITIKNNYVSLLDPEGMQIKDIFIRKPNYSIEIAKKYADDEFIVLFYDKMKFSSELRRLDYLILNMRGLYNKLGGNNNIKGVLLQIIDKLQRKRNRVYG